MGTYMDALVRLTRNVFLSRSLFELRSRWVRSMFRPTLNQQFWLATNERPLLFTLKRLTARKLEMQHSIVYTSVKLCQVMGFHSYMWVKWRLWAGAQIFMKAGLHLHVHWLKSNPPSLNPLNAKHFIYTRHISSSMNTPSGFKVKKLTQSLKEKTTFNLILQRHCRGYYLKVPQLHITMLLKLAPMIFGGMKMATPTLLLASPMASGWVNAVTQPIQLI